MTADELDRVTSATLRVLEVLVESRRFGGRFYALAIAHAARVHVGSVYPILARLEKKRWVSGEWEDRHPQEGRPRRRFYELTTDGMEAAEALLKRRRTPSHSHSKLASDPPDLVSSSAPDWKHNDDVRYLG
jgi:PadR family transcriptional regulator, regulatory protein PadR